MMIQGKQFQFRTKVGIHAVYFIFITIFIMAKAIQDNDFLGADYVAPPPTSRYMKMMDGENNFRILENPIKGWIYWDQTGEK